MPPRKSKSVVPPLTREQCRQVDDYAINQLGIPGVLLMENAGRNAADWIERWAGELLRSRAGGQRHDRRPICVVCGKGNNGGDGFVVARQLVNRGWEVVVDLAAEGTALSGDAAVNYTIASRMGIPIHELSGLEGLRAATGRWREAVVVVDALLGTGFSGEVRDPLAGVIRAINELRPEGEGEAGQAFGREGGPLIVSIDVPSGLHADEGTACGPAVRAHRTITLLATKTGYRKKTSRAYVGRLTVADIGAPTELILKRLGFPNGRDMSGA